jgi:hypothetical protein
MQSLSPAPTLNGPLGLKGKAMKGSTHSLDSAEKPPSQSKVAILGMARGKAPQTNGNGPACRQGITAIHFLVEAMFFRSKQGVFQRNPSYGLTPFSMIPFSNVG